MDGILPVGLAASQHVDWLILNVLPRIRICSWFFDGTPKHEDVLKMASEAETSRHLFGFVVCMYSYPVSYL